MEHTDPVCGMTVEEGKEAARSDYNGTTYYFCSKGCKEAFDKAPTRYINPDGSINTNNQMKMGH